MLRCGPCDFVEVATIPLIKARFSMDVHPQGCQTGVWLPYTGHHKTESITKSFYIEQKYKAELQKCPGGSRRATENLNMQLFFIEKWISKLSSLSRYPLHVNNFLLFLYNHGKCQFFVPCCFEPIININVHLAVVQSRDICTQIRLGLTSHH